MEKQKKGSAKFKVQKGDHFMFSAMGFEIKVEVTSVRIPKSTPNYPKIGIKMLEILKEDKHVEEKFRKIVNDKIASGKPFTTGLNYLYELKRKRKRK